MKCKIVMNNNYGEPVMCHSNKISDSPLVLSSLDVQFHENFLEIFLEIILNFLNFVNLFIDFLDLHVLMIDASDPLFLLAIISFISDHPQMDHFLRWFAAATETRECLHIATKLTELVGLALDFNFGAVQLEW